MKLQLVDRFGGSMETARPFRDLEKLDLLVASLGLSDWLVDLVLADDSAMAELNRSFRDVPEVTDVLSFSYLLRAGGSKPDLAEGDGEARCDLWLDPLESNQPDLAALRMVGEVILAPEFVTTRCRDRGWLLDQEIPLLVVHGCLHLLGWEHDQEQECQAMQTLESRLLAGVGLPHPLAGN